MMKEKSRHLHLPFPHLQAGDTALSPQELHHQQHLQSKLICSSLQSPQPISPPQLSAALFHGMVLETMTAKASRL